MSFFGKSLYFLTYTPIIGETVAVNREHF